MSEKRASILVVDDDEAKRYSITRLLTKQGFSVTEATTGGEALEKARARPDLVVLDVRLPDMNGFEVCRQLKEGPATAGILVLHMSATLVEAQHRTEGLNAGADGYLTDAVDPGEFLATIRALLRARNAERALRETERRFELLVRSVAEYAIYTCDALGTITSWNEGVQRIFGYSAEQFVNRPYAIAFASKAEAANDLATARASGKIEYDRWHERGDGSRFFATGSMTAIQEEGGEVIGFVNVVRDVTLRRQVEEERSALLAAEHRARQEAERVSRLKDEFLATLSHELRTPLGTILGWSQLLKGGALSADEAREGIEVIGRSAQAQAQLIEDLLDVTRIISGKMRLSIAPVDLAACVSAAVESVQTLADARQIRITTHRGQRLDTIAGDATRLQQIVWNLLTNAVKFSAQGGEVAVDLRRLDGQVEISVADTGQGIDPEFLPYAFDRFRQADASTTRAHGGLGLGLAIVRHLTELHGGTVEAESAGRGRGATFRVRLPISGPPQEESDPATAPARATLTAHDAQPPPDLTGLRLLVIEDDPDARTLLRKILQRSGAQVLLAESSAEGVRKFAADRPHLVICDIGMPGEDGYDCLRRIRELESGEQPVPAIALTAFAQSFDRRRALRAGFQIHLPKPVIPAELLSVIDSLRPRGTRRSGAQ